MEDQNQAEQDSLLLGRTYSTSPWKEDRQDPDADRGSSAVGVPTGGDPFTLDGDGHVLTLAPSGPARTRACILPNLLHYPGQVVVVDPGGEAYAVTSRARREMGHTVVRLDPFGVIDGESDALNPLELALELDEAQAESTFQDIADLLPVRCSRGHDALANAAFGLLAGVMGYVASVPEKQQFADIYSTFHSDDVVYNLAVVLDTIGKQIPKSSYGDIASFLQKEDAERSRILTAVTSNLKCMASQEVQKTLARSSVPLADVAGGKPVSFYLVCPPEKLRLHAPLLCVWVGTLLHCAMRRRARSAPPTLFLLDECAQLGTFPLLETALTSCAGSGLRIWTFWHDLCQLRGLYPASWPTMLGGCGAVQLFGTSDHAASSEAAAAFGIEPGDVRSLAADEQIVCRDGGADRTRRLDYAADPQFAGRFDEIPVHAGGRGA